MVWLKEEGGWISQYSLKVTNIRVGVEERVFLGVVRYERRRV